MSYLSTRIPACAPTGSTNKEWQQKRGATPPNAEASRIQSSIKSTDLFQIKKILTACHAPALFAASAAC